MEEESRVDHDIIVYGYFGQRVVVLINIHFDFLAIGLQGAVVLQALQNKKKRKNKEHVLVFLLKINDV